jgi:hypothetical protein
VILERKCVVIDTAPTGHTMLLIDKDIAKSKNDQSAYRCLIVQKRDELLSELTCKK